MTASARSGTMIAPVRLVRVRRVRRDDASLRRALGRLEVQRAVDDRAGRLAGRAHASRPSVDLAGLAELVEVDQPQVVGLRVDPVAEHEPVAVARQTARTVPRSSPASHFRRRVLAEDQRVLRDADRPCDETAPGRCTGPSGSSGSDRRSRSRQAASPALASCRESRAAAPLPVSTSSRCSVVFSSPDGRCRRPPACRHATARATPPSSDPDGSRAAGSISTRSSPRGAFAPVEDGLVLAALALREEVARGAHGRRRHGAHFHQRPQPILERLPAGQMIEDVAGVGVLRVGPRRHLGRDLLRIRRLGRCRPRANGSCP